MASDHVSSDPVPQCPITALEHDSLSPGSQCQENVPHAARTVTTSNELDFLFSPMFDELLNGSTQVVSKSSTVTTADAPNQCETPEVLIDFLRLVQRGFHAQVRIVRTDKGTKFLNKTLRAYFASEWINHQTSVARIPKQNSVVE
uniref:Integrase catalytic domain-containing protein n=1 Tax=Tanacetum cinerariifolium TaxID=118510 RepID=A0A699T0G8_TANCI|nr:hypothetical protein [Tanacetum cinerariifolium]